MPAVAMRRALMIRLERAGSLVRGGRLGGFFGFFAAVGIGHELGEFFGEDAFCFGELAGGFVIRGVLIGGHCGGRIGDGGRQRGFGGQGDGGGAGRGGLEFVGDQRVEFGLGDGGGVGNGGGGNGGDGSRGGFGCGGGLMECWRMGFQRGDGIVGGRSGVCGEGSESLGGAGG